MKFSLKRKHYYANNIKFIEHFLSNQNALTFLNQLEAIGQLYLFSIKNYKVYLMLKGKRKKKRYHKFESFLLIKTNKLIN